MLRQILLGKSQLSLRAVVETLVVLVPLHLIETVSSVADVAGDVVGGIAGGLAEAAGSIFD